MLKLRRLYCVSREFDLLASLIKCNSLFVGNQNTKQLAFLTISSTPSLKNIRTNFNPLLLAESAYAHPHLLVWVISER